MPDTRPSPYFVLFNEIGILHQLSRALLEARLPDGLLSSHFGVLNHLVRVGEGTTPLAIARAFQVPKTTMTHTLSGCVKHGLIEMRPNPEDARSKCIWLTDKGRQVREDMVAAAATGMGDFAEHFPEDKVEALLPALTEMRQFLDKARDEI
ncbi:MarR family transcriptional regulator [Sedimentitalea sp. CY04]|uniref:MarR family transcriptional regulator n=1 Tax=Parasedimentitalea denitrificans TaxID=2211118 RepID=A0ABX0WBL7_9RHOB|nr:MarR family winged helix-turn-helix transcriptional regulator [Sedimentitalea sp. CY04]NIZ63070.1 MarR family transcriptional regulator [Sedimentitalea sp. CY04]